MILKALQRFDFCSAFNAAGELEDMTWSIFAMVSFFMSTSSQCECFGSLHPGHRSVVDLFCIVCEPVALTVPLDELL